MDEADLESHGSLEKHGGYEGEFWSDIAENPDWREQTVHRALRLYERDKNRTSVIMWSLGNEAGYANTDEGDSNFKYAAIALHERDARPVHYEGVYASAKTTGVIGRHVKENVFDVYSRMYATFKAMLHFASGEIEENPLCKPYVLCEYTHAMGNSCGDAEEYWDIIYGHEIFCGAFVWRMRRQCAWRRQRFRKPYVRGEGGNPGKQYRPYGADKESHAYEYAPGNSR